MERHVSHYAIESEDRPHYRRRDVPLFLIADSNTRDILKMQIIKEDYPEFYKREIAWQGIDISRSIPDRSPGGELPSQASRANGMSPVFESRPLRDDEITVQEAAKSIGKRTDMFKARLNRLGLECYHVKIRYTGRFGVNCHIFDVCSREDAQVAALDILSPKR